MLIRGVVLAHGGSPLESAVVSFVEAPTDVADVAAVTGDDGTFVMFAPAAGRYRLAVRADEHHLTRVDVEVGDGDVDVTVTLPSDSG